MSSRNAAVAGQAAAAPDVWRALASPWRRRLLDQLRTAPATTGELAAGLPELSRFAVMQHLAVLTEAGLVVPERRGRDRVNHLNPIPLREWYERWVQPMADTGAAELLALRRAVEKEAIAMSDAIEPIRPAGLRPADQCQRRAHI
jgi:DNA-binding transcriptional ArsR family regulator